MRAVLRSNHGGMSTGTPEPATGPHPFPVEYRIGDLEREQAAQRVIDASGTGHLTVAEADERITKIYAAQWPSELRPLLDDLPPAGHHCPQADIATAPPRGPGRRRIPLLPLVLFVIAAAVLFGPWLHGLLWPALLLTLGTLLVARRRMNHRQPG